MLRSKKLLQGATQMPLAQLGEGGHESS